MSEEPASTERNRNLWAPWRMEYMDMLADGPGGCFFCRYRDDPAGDAMNLVVWRGRRAITVLNRFPYTGGHSMVAPMDHVAALSDLDDQTVLEIMGMVRDLQGALERAVRAEGFNIGINIGRCAGAGLPGHLHVHVVPRWQGDTNFMPVFGGVRIIPQMLQDLRDQILRAAKELHLPES